MALAGVQQHVPAAGASGSNRRRLKLERAGEWYPHAPELQNGVARAKIDEEDEMLFPTYGSRRSDHRRQPKSGARKSGEGLTPSELKVVGVNDMVLLTDLTDQGVLKNLKVRHAANQIYTYIGHVLVVVNPYQWLPIYSPALMMQYHANSNAFRDMEPHVFAVAEQAYDQMLREEENQSVIVSGESGAGKTEAAKQIQNYIAKVSGNRGKGVDKIKRVFLESNPLLEAFGNAKTVRNNNSSRFGKYFELKFDKSGRPLGGIVTNYLLEKSRVVRPGKGERNFHIFYQLLAAAPDKVRKAFGLLAPEQYRYLNSSGCFYSDDADDGQDFMVTMEAMRNVGMKRKQIELALQLVSAILHLGNVTFKPQTVNDADGSTLENTGSLQWFCSLSGLPEKALGRHLGFRTLKTMAPGGTVETYEVPRNPVQATAARDGLSKSLYERLFDFIVGRVNSALDVEKIANRLGELSVAELLFSIGILDIYGFEIFQSNGFEQFCINYVNEKLQQIFISLTLKTEQEEYAREGIAWTPIPYFDNATVLALVEGRVPAGLFLLLDDSCKTAHSTEGDKVDEAFLDKAQKQFSAHAHFAKRGRNFVVRHYAGEVQYNIKGFAEANKDTLEPELVLLLQSSQNKLVRFLYPETIDPSERRMGTTAGAKIRGQCARLVEALSSTCPHYVRCIKSNEEKQPNKIDDVRVLHQVRYLGLVENIKVRRAGFAYRADYGKFLDRFRILSPETFPDWKHSDKRGAKSVLRFTSADLPVLQQETQLGKTCVFIRTPETYFQLERLRDKQFSRFASTIQRFWRLNVRKRESRQQMDVMGELYAQNRKARRADSICRPFLGQYLEGGAEKEAVREIIDFYNPNEKVVFCDKVLQVTRMSPADGSSRGNQESGAGGAAPTVSSVNRLLVITDSALYLLERTNPRAFDRLIYDGNKRRKEWVPPPVLLRRRYSLVEVSGVGLTSMADDILVVQVEQQPALPAPDTHFWLDNKMAPRCMDTAQAFGLFRRRHHCRVSGKLFSDAVCNQVFVVPDRGHYKPVRVWDEIVGLFSTDLKEDFVLRSEKRTEIVSVLTETMQKRWQRQLEIGFQDRYQLRTGAPAELSQSPFSLSASTHEGVQDVSILPDGLGGVSVAAPPGLSEKVLQSRRKRERKRRKRLEEKRRQEAEEREKRQRKREAKREALRQQRIQERKLKKQQEKSSAVAGPFPNQPSVPANVRRFGEAIHSENTNAVSNGADGALGTGGLAGAASSELAAALARRRQIDS